jgi:hypothetical protein
MTPFAIKNNYITWAKIIGEMGKLQMAEDSKRPNPQGG